VVTQRLKVSAEAPDTAMGAFSLKADQTPPLNLTVPLSALQEWAELPGRANLVLCSGVPQPPAPGTLTAEDAGLRVTAVTGTDALRVGTARIFMAAETAAAVQAAAPGARGVLTYLVNGIAGPGKGLTPYSMAAAVEPGTGGLPDSWPEGSVVVHPWLAEDLGLKTGDEITLTYYRVTRARLLEEAKASFRVHAVLPAGHPALRREWTPDFPGVTESESCADWKPGIPIRQDLIRPQDDAYWQESGMTPKVWLRLADGQRLWENRFGSLTSFWVPAGGDAAALTDRIGSLLTPEAAGVQVVPVKAQAAQAVAQSMDFGALFLSMSAFLIGTALLLTALLFRFGTAQRAGQIGLLRAVGWTGRQVQRLFAAEALAVSLPAVVLGVGLGLLHARWTLGRLEREWADAALGLQFVPTVRAASLAMAGGITLLLALLVVLSAARRLSRAVPRELLAAGAAALSGDDAGAARTRRFRLRLPPGLAAAGAAGMLFLTGRVSQVFVPMLFFGAGALLLAEGLRALHAALRRMERPGERGMTSVTALGVRQAVRRRGRSVALAALFAAGVFMVTALHAFRQDARRSAPTRDGGTGGFALVGESTLPVYEDLNTEAGQRQWDFEPEEMAGVSIVSFRVRDGDEASCLNLNRAQTPRVMGVDVEALASRGAFVGGATVLGGGDPWRRLRQPAAEPDAVPALMDQYSAMFALGKKLGDTLTVTDSGGRPVKLQLVSLLAGSLLQGNVVLDDQAFVRLHPDTGGAKFFLVDAAAERAEPFRRTAIDLLEARGFSLTPAAERLAQFQAVQNTYLTIFSTLGGLALLLAAVGLAVLVARHVLERRSEFALMQAAGFRTAQLRRMVLAEHGFLLVAGTVLGAAAALLAVWPNLRLAGANGLPVTLLASLLAALLAGGLLFCWGAARLALGGRLVDALRHE
jgi:ABC-type lipoprotein release transport system permease subunit